MKNATDSIAVIIVAGGSGARMGARAAQAVPSARRPPGADAHRATVRRRAAAEPDRRRPAVKPYRILGQAVPPARFCRPAYRLHRRSEPIRVGFQRAQARRRGRADRRARRRTAAGKPRNHRARDGRRTDLRSGHSGRQTDRLDAAYRPRRQPGSSTGAFTGSFRPPKYSVPTSCGTRTPDRSTNGSPTMRASSKPPDNRSTYARARTKTSRSRRRSIC